MSLSLILIDIIKFLHAECWWRNKRLDSENQLCDREEKKNARYEAENQGHNKGIVGTELCIPYTLKIALT